MTKLKIIWIAQLPHQFVAIRFSGPTSALQAIASELVKEPRSNAYWSPELQAWILHSWILLGTYADRFENTQQVLDELEKQSNKSLSAQANM